MSGVVPWSRQKASLEESRWTLFSHGVSCDWLRLWAKSLQESTAESIRGTRSGRIILAMPKLGYVHHCECGRNYRVWALPTILRHKDSIECECGRTIKEWKDARTWNADLIEEPGTAILMGRADLIER